MTSGASWGEALGRTQRHRHGAPARSESPDTNREGTVRPTQTEGRSTKQAACAPRKMSVCWDTEKRRVTLLD